jgi:hypothetical protein
MCREAARSRCYRRYFGLRFPYDGLLVHLGQAQHGPWGLIWYPPLAHQKARAKSRSAFSTHSHPHDSEGSRAHTRVLCRRDERWRWATACHAHWCSGRGKSLDARREKAGRRSQCSRADPEMVDSVVEASDSSRSYLVSKAHGHCLARGESTCSGHHSCSPMTADLAGMACSLRWSQSGAAAAHALDEAFLMLTMTRSTVHPQTSLHDTTSPWARLAHPKAPVHTHGRPAVISQCPPHNSNI